MVILSDLSDVLISGAGEAKEIVTSRFGAKVGLKCWERFHGSGGDFGDLMRGKMSADEFCRRFVSKEKLPFSVEDMKEILSDSFKKRIPGTLDVYKSIKAHPVAIGSKIKVSCKPDIYIVSDHVAELVTEIKENHSDIFEIMRGEFWSYELGHIKRDKRFFYDLLARLDLKKERVIFIDDNVANIKSARRDGVEGILFKNASQLKNDLIKYGFEF